MGEWIRKLFPDSVSFTGKNEKENTTGTRVGEGKGGAVSYMLPKTAVRPDRSVREKTADETYKLVSNLLTSLTVASDLQDLADCLSRELPPIMHFDVGTLRWVQNLTPNDGWEDEPEDEFPESIDLIASGSPLSGAGSIEVEGPIKHISGNASSGGMNGICRARDINGDPVIFHLRSGLVIPLYSGERNIGVFSLFSSRDGVYDEPMKDSSLELIWKGLGGILGRIIELQNTRNDLERATNLLESTEEILVIWRRKGTIWEIECNNNAEDLINRDDFAPESLEGPFFTPPGREWERAMFAWTRAYQDGEMNKLDLDLITSDRRKVRHLCTFSPYFSEEGISGVKMSAVRMKDIGEAIDRLGEMNRNYRLLISLLSHDLKNPLFAIRGYCELLPLTGEEKTRDYTARILKMSSRMARTIEMTRTLVKIQEGKLDGEFQPLDISKMVASSIEMLYPRTSSYRVIFRPKEETYEIQGHPILEQAILNLIDNAMTYSPEGSTISLGLKADLEGVTITVADQGIGVPDEYKERIFESFDRGEGGNNTSGTGLGLSIARGIIALHSGRLWVEDNRPRGSVFNVFIPWEQE